MVDSTAPVEVNVLLATFKKGAPLFAGTGSSFMVTKLFVQDLDEPTELPESAAKKAIANSSACVVVAVVPVLIEAVALLSLVSFSAETSKTSLVANPEYSPTQPVPSSLAVQLQVIAVSPPAAIL